MQGASRRVGGSMTAKCSHCHRLAKNFAFVAHRRSAAALSIRQSLAQRSFQVAGRAVNLSADAKLKRDSTGLPIHGLLLRWSEWNLNQPSPGRLEASIRWSDHPTLMAAYPFAHTLKVIWEVARDSSAAKLTVTTIIEADHGQAVAIAFGWHPYMAVANAASAQIELPRRRPVALAPSGLPILSTPK